MQFQASSESYAKAGFYIRRARSTVEPYLNMALKRSPLANIEMTIRYVPIVMPKDMHEKYKERSKARVKQMICDCAPHLDYETFVSGTFESQITEYLRGIALSMPHLKKFGLNLEQIDEFSNILSGALNEILAVRPDQTRH